MATHNYNEVDILYTLMSYVNVIQSLIRFLHILRKFLILVSTIWLIYVIHHQQQFHVFVKI